MREIREKGQSGRDSMIMEIDGCFLLARTSELKAGIELMNCNERREMSSPCGWSVPEVRVGDVNDDVTTPTGPLPDPSIVIDPSYNDDASIEDAVGFGYGVDSGAPDGIPDRAILPRDGALPLLSLLAVPWPPRRRHSWICR